MTEQQALAYDGVAGQPYDPCYHQACDDITNISTTALRPERRRRRLRGADDRAGRRRSGPGSWSGRPGGPVGPRVGTRVGPGRVGTARVGRAHGGTARLGPATAGRAGRDPRREVRGGVTGVAGTPPRWVRITAGSHPGGAQEPLGGHVRCADRVGQLHRPTHPTGHLEEMTMPSSNPAFSRGFPGAANGQGAQATAWGQQSQQQWGAPAPYTQQSPYAATGAQYLTMDDVVTKTGLTFLVTVLTAAVTWVMVPQDVAFGRGAPAGPGRLRARHGHHVQADRQPGGHAGLRRHPGRVPRCHQRGLQPVYPGIVAQAVIGTLGVFAGMLVVYKTGAIRVTPKLTRWIVGAMFGVLALMLVNLVASLFGFNTGLRDGGPLAIVFSLVVIGVAAFSLLLDFDMADEAIRRGAPPKTAGTSPSACSSPCLAVPGDPASAQLLPRVAATPARTHRGPVPARGPGLGRSRPPPPGSRAARPDCAVAVADTEGHAGSGDRNCTVGGPRPGLAGRTARCGRPTSRGAVHRCARPPRGAHATRRSRAQRGPQASVDGQR